MWAKRIRRVLTKPLLNNPFGISPLPSQVIFYLTFRCNMKCSFCAQQGDYEGGKFKVSTRDEMGFEDWKSIVDQIHSFHPSILLIGGEPLLHKNFLEIAEYIRDKKLRCSVFTNGYFLEEYAKELVNLEINLSISVDGPPEIHDAIRGVRGSFEKIERGIKAYLEACKHRGFNHLHIKLNCVINDLNHDKLIEIVKLAQNLGVNRLQFEHLMFNEPERVEANRESFKRLLNHDNKFSLSAVQKHSINLDVLNDQIRSIKNKKVPILINFLPDFNQKEVIEYYLGNSFNYAANKRCIRPWRVAPIYPNGNLIPCLDYSFGNLRESSFREIWNGQRAKRFRKVLRSIGQFPVCARCCALYINY